MAEFRAKVVTEAFLTKTINNCFTASWFLYQLPLIVTYFQHLIVYFPCAFEYPSYCVPWVSWACLSVPRLRQMAKPKQKRPSLLQIIAPSRNTSNMPGGAISRTKMHWQTDFHRRMGLRESACQRVALENGCDLSR